MSTGWILSAATVVVACARTTPSSETAPRPGRVAEPSSIQPMKLRYHVEHHGDHPSWIFTARVSVGAESYRGRPAWRRSYQFDHISPPASGPDSTIEGTVVLERETLAPLEAQSTFLTARSRLIFRPDRVERTEVTGGESHHTTVAVPGFVVTDVWMGLDLYILGLPLKEGFRKRVAFFEEDQPVRPFELSVERVERIRVPAGEFEAFRILVDPLDGDRRMRSIYHVRTAAPRVVVRKEYVVNPRTEGELKQSTGVEELEAVEPVAGERRMDPARGSAHEP
jgi:hypothetical protein